MINIKYTRENNITLLECGHMDHIKSYLPLTAKFVNIVSGEIHFESELNSFSWCSWQGAELITDILVYTSEGKLLYEWKWDVVVHGDEIEKSLWFYLKSRNDSGIVSNGLVIGSHDGRNGHWIYPIKKNISSATLIDGSKKQFKDLKKNYKDYQNVKLKNTIVTVDGSDVTWYQGGEGYTDTIKEGFIDKWIDQKEITKTTQSSISINTLMKDEQFDWLHLDVEGIDADLILGLEEKPNVIIYESMNLTQEETTRLKVWFDEFKYRTIVIGGNTMATKN